MTNALFVAWRSPEPTGARWGPIGRLEHGPDGYRFLYTHGARTLPGFRPFPEMPGLEEIYESDELFPLFSNRLLTPSRPEYQAYLAWGGFDPNIPPDPIAILGVTEGLRATDYLELFPCPSPDERGCYVNKFFLHGLRHMPAAAQARVAMLTPGEPLLPMFDDFNPHDPNAVAVRTARDCVMIGYVPRYLAREVRQLCKACGPDSVGLQVERVNPNAPLQQKLLCRMRSCWPDDFHPCNGEDFQPIVSGLPSLVG
jgi:hypothetical protein